MKKVIMLALLIFSALFTSTVWAQENIEVAPITLSNPVLAEIREILNDQAEPNEIASLDKGKAYLSENLKIMMGYLIILERDIDSSSLSDDYKNDLKETFDERLDELELFRADIEFAETSADIVAIASKMENYWQGEKTFIKVRYGEYYHALSKYTHTQLKSIKEEAFNVNDSRRLKVTDAEEKLVEATTRLDNANEANKAASKLLDDIENAEDFDIAYDQSIKNLEIASRFTSEAYAFLVEAVTQLRSR